MIIGNSVSLDFSTEPRLGGTRLDINSPPPQILDSIHFGTSLQAVVTMFGSSSMEQSVPNDSMKLLEEKLVGCSLDVIEPADFYMTGGNTQVTYAGICDPFPSMHRVDAIAAKFAQEVMASKSAAPNYGARSGTTATL